ncbi:hypothetical protein [Streptomyces sp. NPDC046727]|uniref:hypothetical protein n=1 Tax=Streptomyces sp. NPDC046727 TaxID=3155373 RepID=UPI00340EBFDA
MGGAVHAERAVTSGAAGRSYSDRPAIEAFPRARLLTLSGATVVHTGHGQDATIAAERPNVPAP